MKSFGIIFVFGCVTMMGRMVSSRFSPRCNCGDAEGDQVCGQNGVTYINGCYAQCKGVEIAHDGECGDRKRRSCQCSFDWDPVCTDHKVTYNNACWAICRGVGYEPGEC